MVERQIELKRRFKRKDKMKKLKAKLAEATGEAREKLIYKIKRLSPWWTEASLTQTNVTVKAANAPEKKERAPSKGKQEGGPRGPARPKADKK